LRQDGGLEPFARGVARVQPFDVGTPVHEREQARCARCSKAHRIVYLRGREPQNLARGRSRAKDADDACRMKSALPKVRMTCSPNRGHGLVSGNNRFQKLRPAHSLRVRDCQRRGHHDAARMH
jgi:hypothetical protein